MRRQNHLIILFYVVELLTEEIQFYVYYSTKRYNSLPNSLVSDNLLLRQFSLSVHLKPGLPTTSYSNLHLPTSPCNLFYPTTCWPSLSLYPLSPFTQSGYLPYPPQLPEYYYLDDILSYLHFTLYFLKLYPALSYFSPTSPPIFHFHHLNY